MHEMGYADPNGGCDECCDIAPFPDSPPEDGDQYPCPRCSTVWTARDVSPPTQPPSSESGVEE